MMQMCIDPTLSVALGDKPPPLYICEECSQRIGGYVFVSALLFLSTARCHSKHASSTAYLIILHFNPGEICRYGYIIPSC